jgi:hypothetical protein
MDCTPITVGSRPWRPGRSHGRSRRAHTSPAADADAAQQQGASSLCDVSGTLVRVMQTNQQGDHLVASTIWSIAFAGRAVSLPGARSLSCLAEVRTCMAECWKQTTSST